MASLRSALSEPGGQPSLRLFRVFGIQLTLNWSWLLLLALLAYLAQSTFRMLGLNWPPLATWSLAVFAALITAASLFAHELAHALVARRFGIPVRTISLFLLGGVAHITRESPTPRAEFLIALSGPLVSMLVGIVSLVLSWPLGDVAPPVAMVLLWLGTVNLSLTLFNLVPAFPLDGGRILRSVVWFAGDDWRWASTVSARVGQITAMGLLFAGVWSLFDGPASMGGLWLILIAWFMYAGATSAHYAAGFQDALRRLTVASVMDRDFGHVQAGTSVQDFAEAHLQQPSSDAAGKAYAVYRDDALVGLLSLRQLGKIPVRTWPETQIERATLPIESAPSLEPGAPALGALHLILEEGAEYVAVMAEGRLLGLVTRDHLARAAAANK